MITSSLAPGLALLLIGPRSTNPHVYPLPPLETTTRSITPAFTSTIASAFSPLPIIFTACPGPPL